MITAGLGLTVVPTESLKRLLSLTIRGELTFPLTITELTRSGLQGRASEILHVVRDLERPAVRAVVLSVLAERRAVEEGRPIGVPPY